jgi:3-demethoxyubiquinol 3-hydroxylase
MNVVFPVASGPRLLPLALARSASSSTAAGQNAPAARLTVLYDGGCPLCRREVGVYKGQAPCDVRFVDVSHGAQAPLPAGTTQAQLLARFHVQRADGTMVSGAEAFVALWQTLPGGWRWLAVVARVPGVTPLLELAYTVFLRGRPALQRVARAWEPPTLYVPPTLWGELRSDHAGETGAVWIYRGVLAGLRCRQWANRGNLKRITGHKDVDDAGVAAFARRHLATEEEHLRLITPVVPWLQRSRLLVPWRMAGFVTGALPALAGPRAVYATVAAVETFVDRHYQHQLDAIDALPDAERAAAQPLRTLLRRCQEDECSHRDEAAAALTPVPPGRLLRAWCTLVGHGSAAAVRIARRV